MDNKTDYNINLQDISLDVIERFIFWFFASFFIAKIASILGYNFTLCFLFIWMSSTLTVLLLDKIKVDPAGRCVLITGCDTGFGNAVARELYNLGFTVFAGVLSTESEGSKTLIKDCNNDPSRIHVFNMNVTSEHDCNNAIHFIENNLPHGSKGLWAVITNAGWSTFGQLEWVPIDVHQKIIDINILGTIRTIKAALPLVRNVNGRVITMSSMCGRFGNPSRSAYSATKWAIEGISECLRAEMKRWNVQVVIVEPGNFVAGTALYAGNAVKSQAEHMWNLLSDRVKSDYTKEYFDYSVELMSGYASGGNTKIEPVVRTMVDAVLHSFPQTRYQVMSPGEKIKCFIATHLPSVFYDIFYN